MTEITALRLNKKIPTLLERDVGSEKRLFE